MRNRPSYHYTPARSEVINRKPAPRRPRANWNQILLLLFFIALPFCGLLALFFTPMKWVFIVLSVAALALMWYQHGFNTRGRLTMSLLFSVLTVVMLVSALTPQGEVRASAPVNTIPPISSYSTQSLTATNVPTIANVGSDGTVGGVPAADTTPDPSMLSGDPAAAGQAGVSTGVRSQAEQALDKFMQSWQVAIMADMVPMTSTSWRAQQTTPAQQLFWKFQNKKLQSWEFVGTPTGSDADSSRTVMVVYDAVVSGKTQTFQAEALMLQENGEWYVDPNSLDGVKIERTTPEPELDYSPLPATATPAPTDKPTKKTVLYYNSKGGKRYHIDPDCASVDPQYLPMTKFKFGDITKSPYNKLEPCQKCDAPDKSALDQ